MCILIFNIFFNENYVWISLVWVYHLSEYTHWVYVYVGYTIYFTLFFSKSIYLNQMHIQRKVYKFEKIYPLIHNL
jgi:hypothetical protein